MSSPTLKYIFLVVFFLALVPLIINLYNKQKTITENITTYDEYIAQFNTPQKADIYEEYMTSVLGTYDQREPRDENIQNILENVDDIVEEFDVSGMEKISPELRLPLSKSFQFDVSNGARISIEEDGNISILSYNGNRYGTIDSFTDLEIYVKGDEEKLVTYWKDESIEGDLVTVWDINHDSKSLEREYTVIEIGN